MSVDAGEAVNALVQRHPLQRLNSPSRSLSAALHILGLASFVNSFKYLVDWPSIVNSSYGWHFQYLTIVGLALATATFFVGLVADATLSRRVFLAKNVLSFCSTPLEVLISLLFWGIRAIDKKLVTAEWMRPDPWADVGFHAIPSVVLTVDLLLFSPPWTIGTLPAVGVSSILALSYWIWVEICFSRNGWYPYPLFEVLSPAWRGALFAGSALVMTLSSVLLKAVYEQVNDTPYPGLIGKSLVTNLGFCDRMMALCDPDDEKLVSLAESDR